jgi:hypothetical protein
MKYDDLDRIWFDAIVTGELTHYALWFEEQLELFISAYFISDPRVEESFISTFVKSREFTISRKIEFARRLLKSSKHLRADEFLTAFKELERIIAIRNAMAHGKDVGGKGLKLKIEIASYGGKTKTIEITPESHSKIMESAEECLEKLKKLKQLGSSLRG